MENLGALFGVCLDLLQTHFDIWGFSISPWNVLVFGCITSAVAWAVWEIIDRS